MRKFKVIAVIASLTLLVSLFAGCGSNKSTSSETETGKKETLKIGAVLPVSGKYKAYGLAGKKAVQMAIEQVNSNGGVLGKQVKLVVKDNKGDKDKTITAFNKLASENVPGFVGPLFSGNSLAVADKAQSKNVVMISPTATSDKLTNAGNYVFRACYNDSYQGQVVASYVFDTLKSTKAAVLFAENDYSKGLKDSFVNTFKSLGGEVVATESYPAEKTSDLSAQLDSVKSANPEVLFVPDYYTEIPTIAKQVREKGINVPMLGADGWGNVTDEKDASSELKGSMYCTHYSSESDNPEVESFVSDYKEKYGKTPNFIAALSYDAANILMDAIEESGSTDAASVRKAVQDTNRRFVTGRIKFNENRNPIKSAVMVRIDEGDEGLTTSYADTVDVK